MFVDVLNMYSDILKGCDSLNHICKYCKGMNNCVLWNYNNNIISQPFCIIGKDLLKENQLTRDYHRGLQSLENSLKSSNLLFKKFNEIESSFSKIKEYILDDAQYTTSVNDTVVNKNVLSTLNDINNSINCLLDKRKYDVEIICNIVEEGKRLKTLVNSINYFNVVPSYTVYGIDTANHELYSHFSNSLSTASISLIINHISILKKYRDTNRPLLILESDAVELYNLSDINNEIIKTIFEMEDYGVEIAFLGKGCFTILDFNALPHPLIKITDTLYRSSHSRCTESVLFTPLGVRNFLAYIESLISDNILIDTAIDWLLNSYFKKYPERMYCWKIPELFLQGSFIGMYNSSA